MRRTLFVFALLWAVAASVPAQNTSTRPRIAATPVPVQPVIQGEAPSTARRSGPPVLGNDSSKRPAPTPTPETADDGTEVIKVETNLITMPVSVLDREGRFVSGLQAKGL